MSRRFLPYATFFCTLIVACSTSVPSPPPPTVTNTAALNVKAAQIDALSPQIRPTLTTNTLEAVNINDSGVGAPQRLWDNTTEEELIVLFEEIIQNYISPASQRIIARVLQTSAKAPPAQHCYFSR
jgi:hypothetical protein